MVRRLGNVAAAIKTSDNELIAIRSELGSRDATSQAKAHLKYVAACHLEFISSVSPAQATQIARSSGIIAELANLRGLKPDLSNAPEVVRAAFYDSAALVKKGMGL